MARLLSLPIKEFLAEFPIPMQELSLALGLLIKKTIPDLIERVYPGWKLIGYRQGTKKKSRYFCFVAPFGDHVRLGFEYGAFLNDPFGMLEGTGSQVRYVSLKLLEEIDQICLAFYIKEAAYLASLPKHEVFLLPQTLEGTMHDAKKRRQTYSFSGPQTRRTFK